MFSSRLFKSKLRYPGVDIERELADGGQATVYLGKLTEGDRSPVAVKVFDNKDGVREYEREVALLLRVGGHPNIVQVVRFHGHKKRPAIVTDLINGTTISDILDQEGAFPVPDAVRFGAEIANAVQHMHSRGVVHRDLKTSNIMLHLSGDNSLASAKPVIIDLGIGATRAAWYAPGGIEQLEKPADVPDEPDDVSVAIKGTREYMAPEMLRAQRWSEKSDSYAFGIGTYACGHLHWVSGNASTPKRLDPCADTNLRTTLTLPLLCRHLCARKNCRSLMGAYYRASSDGRHRHINGAGVRQRTTRVAARHRARITARRAVHRAADRVLLAPRP